MTVVDDIPPQAEPSSGPPGRPAPGPILACARSASTGFGGALVIEGVDLEVAAGETVAIVGRSGCGKTTLLHMLAGLLAPTAGSTDSAPAALMPQRDGLMPWASAQDNAALPLRVAGMPRAQARAAAATKLTELGLGDVVTRRVARLSGGMRQRVALARTLLTGRTLLLLDEPLAAVDALTRADLHALLLGHLARDGHGAVLVTHDLDEAVMLADRVLILGPLTGAAAGSASRLRAGPTLSGAPGQRLAQRGGEALRAALLKELRA